MSRFFPWLKRNFSVILLLGLSAVLAVSLFQVQQAVQNTREVNRDSENRFVASHGLLAAALEGDTLSLENQMLAGQECVMIRRELAGFKKGDTSEKKLANLIRYYDSMEHYLTKTLTDHYLNYPRGEAVALTPKDQSIISFIRSVSQQVYDVLTDVEATDLSVIDSVHSIIGERFEATFHTFDRNDFFRHDDPLKAFFE